jgi:hypothetical protein
MVPQRQPWTTDYGWKWLPYAGSDPHTSHLHISVYGDYDNQSNWNIGEEMRNPTEDEVKHAFMFAIGATPTEKQIKDYSTSPDGLGWLSMYNDLMKLKHQQLSSMTAERDKLKADTRGPLTKMERDQVTALATTVEEAAKKLKEVGRMV